MLILNKAEIESVLTMDKAIEAVESAFQEKQLGKVGQPPNHIIMIPEFKGRLGVKSAWLTESKVLATKVNTLYVNNPIYRNLPFIQGVVLLFNLENGRLLAILEGSSLTAIRTGAITGVATKFLSRPDASTVVIFGAGNQAAAQIDAVCCVRKIEKIKVYDTDLEKARVFAAKLSKNRAIEVVQLERPEMAIRKSDICITVTTSQKPVILGEWVEAGTHLNAIGSYRADIREVDTATIQKAKVVVDSLEHCLQEAGDIAIPILEGTFKPERIYGEIGEIITGDKPGRISSEEITLFKSVGLGLQDVAAAFQAYNLAVEIGLGKEVILD